MSTLTPYALVLALAFVAFGIVRVTHSTINAISDTLSPSRLARLRKDTEL